MYCHIFYLIEKNKRIIREINTQYSGFRKIDFNNRFFLIPNDEKQRLIDTYGEEYKIPIKEWHTPRDALNSKIIDKKIIYSL